MADTALRQAIVTEMKSHELKQRDRFVASGASRLWYGQYCTWWFRHHIPFTTKEVRRELFKMEREGLVTADRGQSNNTRWLLVEEATA